MTTSLSHTRTLDTWDKAYQIKSSGISPIIVLNTSKLGTLNITESLQCCYSHKDIVNYETSYTKLFGITGFIINNDVKK